MLVVGKDERPNFQIIPLYCNEIHHKGEKKRKGSGWNPTWEKWGLKWFLGVLMNLGAGRGGAGWIWGGRWHNSWFGVSKAFGWEKGHHWGFLGGWLEKLQWELPPWERPSPEGPGWGETALGAPGWILWQPQNVPHKKTSKEQIPCSARDGGIYFIYIFIIYYKYILYILYIIYKF